MLALKNGLIVTPTQVLEGQTLLIKNGRIAGIAAGVPDDCPALDAQGSYLIPGLIDTHSDGIEQVVLPRPNCPMDFELALRSHERILASQGITTMYHSISLYDKSYFGEKEIRKQENTFRFAELIHDHQQNQHMIRHRFHLRVELDNMSAFEIVKGMLEQKLLHALSFMDHTPGQGQYRNIEQYRKALNGYAKGIDDEKFQQILEEHNTKAKLSFEQMKILSDLALAQGLPVASHDDDTVEKLLLNQKLGVTLSEFPITMEVAKTASQMGFSVTAGAPNVLRGGSHSGNMSAIEGVQAGCVDTLCSDYNSISLLQSIFMLHEKYGIALPEAVNLCTLGPARAMKIDKDYGSLSEGKKADLLFVQKINGYPTVTAALIDGIQIFGTQYRTGGGCDERSTDYKTRQGVLHSSAAAADYQLSKY